MKMPEKIEPAMLAPCGMNCLVCYIKMLRYSVKGTKVDISPSNILDS